MSWIIASRVAAFALFGVVLNAALLFLDRHALLSCLNASDASVPAARAGGAGAVIALVVLLYTFVLQNTVFFALLALFVVGFPFAHLLLAKRYAVSAALSFALERQQAALVRYLVEHALQAVMQHPDYPTWLHQGGLGYALERCLGPYLRRLSGMPLPIRMALRQLLKKFDLASELVARLRSLDPKLVGSEDVARAASELFSKHVAEKLFVPSLRAFYVVTSLNVLCATLVAIGVRVLN